MEVIHSRAIDLILVINDDDSVKKTLTLFVCKESKKNEIDRNVMLVFSTRVFVCAFVCVYVCVCL